MVDVKIFHRHRHVCELQSRLHYKVVSTHTTGEMRRTIETIHAGLALFNVVSIRLKELPLAHPSTAEPMLDARHSHCSHSNNLEHMHAYAQPVEQTLQLPQCA